MVVVKSSFSVMLLLPDSIETERIKVTNFDIVEELGDTIAVIVDGFVCGISKSFFETSSLPLHQHDSLYFRETELTNGSTDLWLDSVNMRQLMINGASYYVPPAGEQWVMDCMLGLKDDLIYKLSSSEALSFAGAAPASHTHDDRYYTETEIGTLFYTKTQLTDGSTDLSVANLTANSVYANMGLRIGQTAGYVPNVGFNYVAPVPFAYFVDTDALTEAATAARLGFMCQATASVVGMLDYASSTLTLENMVSGGGINLTTDGGRVTVDDALTVGSVGASTATGNFIYGADVAVMRLIDNSVGDDNTSSLAYMSFHCAATDSNMGYVGYGYSGNTSLYVRNSCYSGSILLGTRGRNDIEITPAGNLVIDKDLAADSISGRVVKVPGDTSYSVTVTLYDGSTSRGTATAYIAKDAQRRIAYVSVPTKTGTITASTLTTLPFPSNTLPDPVNGATVIIGPLKSNVNDIAGILWVKNDDKIELHTTNPWGYLAAGTGGITATDFSYRY